jgi:hypothetical protein
VALPPLAEAPAAGRPETTGSLLNGLSELAWPPLFSMPCWLLLVVITLLRF